MSNPSSIRRWERWLAVLALCTGVCGADMPLWAETGILVVNVQDVHRHPVAGLKIGVGGDGGSDITDDNGKARIRIAAENKPSDWVTLQILRSPPGREFVMVSPWDSRTPIPSFENKSDNSVLVVVVVPGDRAALENGAFLAALAEKINQANASKNVGSRGGGRDVDPEASLAAVARHYGLDPKELDKAIRSWETTDPYEAGLAALYERNYPAAAEQLRESERMLRESVRIREGKLAADQSAVADAAFFLGQALYEEGEYREAAAAFQRCLQLTPDSAAVLDHLGMALIGAGGYQDAERFLNHALAVKEALSPNDPSIGLTLSALAVSLEDQGDYGRAEQLLSRAGAIYQQTQGPDSPQFASYLSNVGTLFQIRRDYRKAEPLFRRALSVDEGSLGPGNPRVATDLNNLALLLELRGDYAHAEPLFRRAMKIDEKALGPDHPDLAIDLNNLGQLLEEKGEYVEARQLLDRSLAIRKKRLGPNHPDVAQTMNNIAELLISKREYASAEGLLRQALAIKREALVPDDPSIATGLANLADVLRAQHDYPRAEPLFREALEIDERALGLDNPEVAVDAINLAGLLDAEKNYADAEQLFRRALTVMEKNFGDGDRRTENVRGLLNAVVAKEAAERSRK